MPKEKRKQKCGEWEEIAIDHKVFSRNHIDKLHWAEKGKLKGQYRILIRNQMRLNKVKETDKKCNIKITCYVKRLMDTDNMWGGLKQFIDALSTENFIYDDSPNWLNIQEVRQIKAKESKIVVVRKVCC